MTEVATPQAPEARATSPFDVTNPPAPPGIDKTPAPPPAAAADAAKDGTGTPDAAPDPNQDAPKPKRPASERISELYAQKKEAERRAAAAEQTAIDLRKQLQAPANIDPNDFDAQNAYRMRHAVKAERHEQTVHEARAAQAAAIDATANLFQAKVEAAKEKAKAARAEARAAKEAAKAENPEG